MMGHIGIDGTHDRLGTGRDRKVSLARRLGGSSSAVLATSEDMRAFSVSLAGNIVQYALHPRGGQTKERRTRRRRSAVASLTGNTERSRQQHAHA